MVEKRSIAIAVAILLLGFALPARASATELNVAAGTPISCTNNSWIVVLMGKSGSQALIFCQLPSQDRVPLSRVKCPNESDRLTFTTNVVMSNVIVDGLRRPTNARFRCYRRPSPDNTK